MEDRNVSLEAVSSLYGSNLKEFGPEARALGWKSRQEQRLRFDVLTKRLDPNEPVDLIDYGCGFADLLDYLLNDRNADVVRYIGYEINSDVAAIAEQRLSATEINGAIVNSSLLEHTADWALISGTFNVRLDEVPHVWEARIRETLKNIFRHTRIGLSFNLLTTYVDWQDDGLFYADPLAFFDFCKRELSPRVSLDHDYPLYEWTLTVLH